MSSRSWSVDLLEGTPMTRRRKSALLARVLDDPVGLEASERHLEVDLAREDPEGEASAVAGACQHDAGSRRTNRGQYAGRFAGSVM